MFMRGRTARFRVGRADDLDAGGGRARSRAEDFAALGCHTLTMPGPFAASCRRLGLVFAIPLTACGGLERSTSPPPGCVVNGALDPNATMCSGVCVDEQTDQSNCGGCGLTCSVPCVAGRCLITRLGMAAPMPLRLMRPASTGRVRARRSHPSQAEVSGKCLSRAVQRPCQPQPRPFSPCSQEWP
jgi:hypothetical protein